MTTTHQFRLPGGALEVAPALRVNGAVAPRKYVLLFDLPENSSLTLDDPTLTWSDSLRSLYRYVPETESAGVIQTPSFSVPEGARSLRVRVHTWSAEAPSAMEDIVLTTTLQGRPVVIFREEA